jgi:hypothetical protein
MTKDEMELVKPHIDAMVASGENCSLCGGERDRVVTATLITTSNPPWRRVLISPLCKACAEDPELKTRMLEKDFMNECVDVDIS